MRGIIGRHNVRSDARDRSNLGRGRLAVAFTLLLLGVMSALSAPQAPQAAVRTPQSNAAPAVVVNAAPSGPVGRWQAINVPNAPWTFEFAVSGTSLTGTVQQNGVPTGPTSISAGKSDGPLITFKILSPDGERVIFFTGQLSGNEISFTRQVTPLEGGSGGGNDVYGALAPMRFVAGRVGSDRFNFSGVEVDIASVRSSPTRDATLEALRGQIAIVDAAVKDPAQKAFLKSVPLAMAASPGATPNNAAYSSGTKSVALQSMSYDPDKPVLLHELMHAYHDQKLPNGFANGDIQKLFQQARSSGQFPAGTYMLSNVAEYFAMMSSVYLHGSAARDPFTRQTIKEKQPDCYDWLVKEFGPR